MSVYAKKILKKGLRCISLWSSVCCEGEIHLEQCEAQRGRQSGWASNHNVTWTYIMACLHDIQTRPEFVYLFLAVARSNPQDKPHREEVVALSEQEARKLLAGRFVLSFAGRIPVQEVAHV
ncbi:host cell division inhibitor Icd-like protein [Salmonella enterica]|nr:host cell division inhibitor Icd-like protein [Salmonella enterica]